MPIKFRIENWYWKIGGNSGVYSSASNTYVAETEAAYVAWLADGNAPAKIATEAELWGSYIQRLKPTWLFDGATFVQPTPTSYTKAQLKAYSAAARYEKETGGTMVNGAAVATDRQSQAMIAGANNMATRNGTFTTQWKNVDGTFALLDASTIIALATAVGQHVAACFAAEANVASQIDSGAIISLPLIDQAYAGIS
ncbi:MULTISPECIES: DUF4376 domain-containing protein [unclassified Bradyrhizobium]|uniref:DUF4376 domain-containing protein n=1 Tax=unclassified Bradyrhizobium TaxID=2631580 RepID=UPI002916A8D9|nr:MULTISPECIES: DUF4376 domain-containing protein [unclassified Bradyrhizobium]